MAWVVGLLLAATVVLAPNPAEAACEEGYYEWVNCNPIGCGNFCDEAKGCCSTCVGDGDHCHCY